MTPAIAPATALGRERVETLSTSALWRSTAWAELPPTARAMGADWDVFIRFSSGVVETDEMSGWMGSDSCDARPIVETPHSCEGRLFGDSALALRLESRPQNEDVYRAYSVARVSRITVTLI